MVEGGQATKMKSLGRYGVIEKVARFFIFHVTVTGACCLPPPSLYLAPNYYTSTKMSWREALSELHLFQFRYSICMHRTPRVGWAKCKSILFISCLIVQKFFFSNFWLSFFSFRFAKRGIGSMSKFIILNAYGNQRDLIHGFSLPATLFFALIQFTFFCCSC